MNKKLLLTLSLLFGILIVGCKSAENPTESPLANSEFVGNWFEEPAQAPYPTFTIKLDNIGKVSFHFGGTISSLDMLYDSLPERIKSEPDFIKMVNIGSVGDVKSQNLPRNTNND